MSKYRKISPKIWNDAKFRGLSDNAKLVFLMLLTHPATSSVGTMRSFVQGLAPEMGWTEKAFREAFQEGVSKGLVKYSEKDGLIWLPNFIKHNLPENPNVLKSWAPALDDCPECSLKNEVYIHVRAFAEGYGKAFAIAFGEAFGKGMPNQEQEQEQEQDKEITPNGVIVGEGSPPPVEPVKSCSMGNCPQEEILVEYHRLLPELPRMKSWDGERQKHLRARWRERWAAKKFRTQQEGIMYFCRLFAYIRDSDFLMGKKSGKDGRVFIASLDWIVRPNNFAKIIEGRYHESSLEAA